MMSPLLYMSAAAAVFAFVIGVKKMSEASMKRQVEEDLKKLNEAIERMAQNIEECENEFYGKKK